MHIMNSMNYKIKCLITINSENKDSYMYHTPLIDLTSLQAKSLNMPIILEKTKGIKEKELTALRKALKRAKEKYKINGISTGALYSNYQRERIEKIADKIGLKVFSPLWHKDQYFEVLEIINLGIKTIIVKIASYGLDKNLLGKVIDKNMLETFSKLNKKIGFNIAGEGGEYETFVIDAPLFKKKIEIKDFDIKTIDQYTYETLVKKVLLIKKS